MDKLLTCPFCNSVAAPTYLNPNHYVHCVDPYCPLHGVSVKRERWNHRRSHAALEPVQQARDLLVMLRGQVDAEPRLAPVRVAHWIGNAVGHLDRALASLPVPAKPEGDAAPSRDGGSRG